MTFTYTPAAATDSTRVRFHTGDTVEAEAYLSDEEITFLLAEESSWQRATISAIKFIIAKLSKPNFKADWLQVDHASARKGFESLLQQKRQEFGIAAVTTRSQATYRPDSGMDEVPEAWGE